MIIFTRFSVNIIRPIAWLLEVCFLFAFTFRFLLTNIFLGVGVDHEALVAMAERYFDPKDAIWHKQELFDAHLPPVDRSLAQYTGGEFRVRSEKNTQAILSYFLNCTLSADRRPLEKSARTASISESRASLHRLRRRFCAKRRFCRPLRPTVAARRRRQLQRRRPGQRNVHAPLYRRHESSSLDVQCDGNEF